MDNTKVFEEAYKDSYEKEDSLGKIYSYLGSHGLIFEEMLKLYIKSMIECYIILEGELKSMDLLETFARSTPQIFAESVKEVLSDLSAPDLEGDQFRLNQIHIDWFSNNHPEIYQDFMAEQAENKARCQSPAAKQELSEGFERLMRRIRERRDLE